MQPNPIFQIEGFVRRCGWRGQYYKALSGLRISFRYACEMNRIALITGGSKGLGAHLVRRFWLDGYSLIVVSRNLENINSVLEELPKRGNQEAKSLVCDLSNVKKVENLLDLIFYR